MFCFFCRLGGRAIAIAPFSDDPRAFATSPFSQSASNLHPMVYRSPGHLAGADVRYSTQKASLVPEKVADAEAHNQTLSIGDGAPLRKIFQWMTKAGSPHWVQVPFPLGPYATRGLPGHYRLPPVPTCRNPIQYLPHSGSDMQKPQTSSFRLCPAQIQYLLSRVQSQYLLILRF
jgi:hypothetical protein